jgi:hypothetical protein
LVPTSTLTGRSVRPSVSKRKQGRKGTPGDGNGCFSRGFIHANAMQCNGGHQPPPQYPTTKADHERRWRYRSDRMRARGISTVVILIQMPSPHIHPSCYSRYIIISTVPKTVWTLPSYCPIDFIYFKMKQAVFCCGMGWIVPSFICH